MRIFPLSDPPKQCSKAGSKQNAMSRACLRLLCFLWLVLSPSSGSPTPLTHRQENDRCKLKEKHTSWWMSQGAGAAQHNFLEVHCLKWSCLNPLALVFVLRKFKVKKKKREKGKKKEKRPDSKRFKHSQLVNDKFPFCFCSKHLGFARSVNDGVLLCVFIQVSRSMSTYRATKKKISAAFSGMSQGMQSNFL